MDNAAHSPSIQEDVVNEMRKWFFEIGIELKDEWVQNAIAFLGEEITKEKLFEQFAHSRLEDSYFPPIKIPEKAFKVFLTKKTVFQVISVVDVGRSIYEQFREDIRPSGSLSWFNGGEENEDDVGGSVGERSLRRRCLKLEISDGVTTLTSFEQGLLSELSAHTPPGTKIFLRSRGLCRRGVLLLNDGNCSVIGGAFLNGKEESVAEKLYNLLPHGKRTRIEPYLSKVKREFDLNQRTLTPFLVRLPVTEKVASAPARDEENKRAGVGSTEERTCCAQPAASEEVESMRSQRVTFAPPPVIKLEELNEIDHLTSPTSTKISGSEFPRMENSLSERLRNFAPLKTPTISDAPQRDRPRCPPPLPPQAVVPFKKQREDRSCPSYNIREHYGQSMEASYASPPHEAAPIITPHVHGMDAFSSSFAVPFGRPPHIDAMGVVAPPPAYVAIQEKMIALDPTRLCDVVKQRRYWMMPKTLNVIPMYCRVPRDMKAEYGMWLLHIEVKEEYGETVYCALDSKMLEQMLGFSVEYCKGLSMSNNQSQLMRLKEKAMRVIKSFGRLDLILTVEVSQFPNELPVITKIQTIHDVFIDT